MSSPTDLDDLPEEAWLAALVALPRLGPARLAKLLDGRTARAAWLAVLRDDAAVLGEVGAPKASAAWPSAARALDVAAVWARYRSLDIGVLGRAAAGYPELLADDAEAPAVLFTTGSVGAVGHARVGIVGTRRCTRYGVDLAHDLGRLCASNGVTVVSGLAAGIDAAAHAGALAAGGAPPVGVVGTSVDSPYPAQNRELWGQVASAGLVCGETPLGAPAERWRFPARNRIIAALSQVVVVVESHETGGSLYTANQAMERGRLVFAVPGAIRSPSSAGCNRLIADGCMPLCDLDDVLVALGLTASPRRETDATAPVLVDPTGRQVLEAVGWQPCTLDEVVSRVGLGLSEVALAVEGLVADGLLVHRGRWLERTGRSAHVDRPNDPTTGPATPPWLRQEG